MPNPTPTIDFFGWQDQARRQTLRLVVLFALSVAAIIGLVYLVAVLTLSGFDDGRSYHHVRPDLLWNPQIFLAVAGGVLAVVSLGSLYKIAELASGGETVALMLGGRSVDPQTTDPVERRLLNVVEEMSIAAGIPMPPVFVLDNEPAINAFAAGFHPRDAVVAVSRGALTYLSREELQGVMGHEFSHILNGDMRLNLRLMGLIHGILVLSIIGYYVMRFAPNTSDDRENKQAGLAVLLVGLALYILGYIGVFFGQLIQSAISRQREYLADASSVQFTRYPPGIAGALKKIGGLADGSRIRDPHAHEASHFFFGDALAGSFFNLFATHPPLADRIRRLDPNFDGNFAPSEPAMLESTAPAGSAARAAAPQTAPRPAPQPVPQPEAAPAAALAMGLAGGPPARPVTSAPPRRVGPFPQEQLDQAGQWLARLPQPLADAARDPYSARGVVYALLVSRDDPATRARQLEILRAQVEPALARLLDPLLAAADAIGPQNRLPLAELCTGALRRMSPQQYAAFRQMVDVLTNVDGRVDLFEYCLRTVLLAHLDVPFQVRPMPAIRYRALAPLAGPLTTILSSLAYAGQADPQAVRAAFGAGMSDLLPQAALLPAAQCTFAAFDAALDALAQATPPIKQRAINACLQCIAADGKTTLEEDELLRAIAAVLGCPIPPQVVAS